MIYEPSSGVGTDSFRYGIGVVFPVFAPATIDVEPVAEPSTTTPTTTTATPATTATPPPAARASGQLPATR